MSPSSCEMWSTDKDAQRADVDKRRIIGGRRAKAIKSPVIRRFSRVGATTEAVNDSVQRRRAVKHYQRKCYFSPEKFIASYNSVLCQQISNFT